MKAFTAGNDPECRPSAVASASFRTDDGERTDLAPRAGQWRLRALLDQREVKQPLRSVSSLCLFAEGMCPSLLCHWAK